MSDSRTVRVRCKAMNRSNRRCKHNTLRGLYCWQHLKKEKGLRIKNSNIPDAGFGLYTTIPRERGQNVAAYTGEIVVSHDPNYGNNYVLQIKQRPPTFIDASRTDTGAGRYSNMCKRGDHCRNNANLTYNARTGNAWVKATQRIPAGAEVYTNYGRDYWRNHGNKRAKKAKKAVS